MQRTLLSVLPLNSNLLSNILVAFFRLKKKYVVIYLGSLSYYIRGFSQFSWWGWFLKLDLLKSNYLMKHYKDKL